MSNIYIINKIEYLLNILYNNNVKIDNLPHNLYSLKLNKLLNLEKQLLYIFYERNIDVNDTSSKIINKNIKGNERIDYIQEIKNILIILKKKYNDKYKNITDEIELLINSFDDKMINVDDIILKSSQLIIQISTYI